MAGAASRMPVRPPKRKVTRKPMEKIIGVSKLRFPFHMVPIQLKNLTPVGTAMRNDMAEKYDRRTAPVVNMWWAQTPTDRPAMARVANTMPV